MDNERTPAPGRPLSWIEWILLAIAGFCVLTALSGCVKAHTVKLYNTTHSLNGSYTYYVDDDGNTILILHSSAAYADALKELCKTPCSVAEAGEMFVLIPLVKEKKNESSTR